MVKRYLTSSEIDSFFHELFFIRSLPQDVYSEICSNLKSQLLPKLQKITLYEEKIPEFIQTCIKMYRTSLIDPGKQVGTIAAQSMGENLTQKTLNTFHSAGITQKAVLSGVPRFNELLYATENPKAASLTLKFTKNNSSVKELRENISHHLVEVFLEQVIDFSVPIEFVEEELRIPEYFFDIYNNELSSSYTKGVKFSLNKKILFEHNLTPDLIKEKLEESYNDIYCYFTSLQKGFFYILFDMSAIELKEDIDYITEDNKYKFYFYDVIFPKIRRILISGLRGVKKAYYQRDKNNNLFVETDGSNLRDVLTLPNLDFMYVMSNDMWEIYYMFGIEAAREFLIREFTAVIFEDGTYMSPKVIKLVVDAMTYKGTIVSVTRYGILRYEVGPITKSSFEECTKNLKIGALCSDLEKIKKGGGISSSIICSVIPPIGGNYKLELFQDMSKILKERIEEKDDFDAMFE